MYTPPANNEIDFDLKPYTLPPLDEIDFQLVFSLDFWIISDAHHQVSYGVGSAIAIQPHSVEGIGYQVSYSLARAILSYARSAAIIKKNRYSIQRSDRHSITKKSGLSIEEKL